VWSVTSGARGRPAVFRFTKIKGMPGVLNLPKALGLILEHVQVAVTAAGTWWSRMSDSDKRQARQRVLTIGACAAVFAFGGPLIAQRFGDQKAEEAYRADAIVLAQSIAA